MNNSHILIIEDEVKIAQILVDYLEDDGYIVSVLYEGTNAIDVIIKTQPHFLILDLMLPGKDGLTICREVREFSNIPILMLTARVDEMDKLAGLEIGADDYVCKPFLPREVVARVKAILRRFEPNTAKSSQQENLQYGDIQLYPEQYKCVVSGHDLELTPVEFRMLQTLMGRPGFVYSRNKLMHSSYADDRIVSDRTIDSHIKNLRHKLNNASIADEVIHSIYGVGYKFE